MPAVDDIIKKYVELRDRQAEISKRHAEELRPLSEAMDTIENYLMHQMNVLGVDQLKASGVGTAFKANASSCQMQDPSAFKDFIFNPVVEGIHNYLLSAGYGIRNIDLNSFAMIIRDMPLWDMVDFRAGKKGITEYIANNNKAVPGVSVNTVSKINVRRA